ncbi:MAG: class I SAM-dependent methyltransferase [Thermoleophilia bacterium]
MNDETAKTRRRYDRIAPMYDLMEWVAERRAMEAWRSDLWKRVEGRRVLEVGVGTGKNFPFYKPGMDVVAIDFSPRMIERARQRAATLGTQVQIFEMDVQDLAFEEASFDAVVTSCVFCSVPDPVRGFQELLRVLEPGGKGYFLEHVLSTRPGARRLMETINPVVVRMMGANINRQTRSNLQGAGFVVESEEDLWLDIVKLFVARKP